jgi:hypothetical protein
MRTTTLGLLTIALLSSAVSLPASALTLVYNATLSGPAEEPPNSSPGTGTAIVTIGDVANTMRVQATFGALVGTSTVAHIHCCTAEPNTGTAGVATQVPTFEGFPQGVTSGTYDNTFDMLSASSFNPAFLNNPTNLGSPAAAFATLLDGLNGRRAYFNLHSTEFPGGEIRGFLSRVPEPGPAALFGLGLAGLVLVVARRHRTGQRA